MPRHGSGRILLSWLDDVLLSALSTSQWRTGLDLIRQHRTNRVMSVLDHFGDLLIPMRLSHWGSQRPEAVEARAEPNGWAPVGRGGRGGPQATHASSDHWYEVFDRCANPANLLSRRLRQTALIIGAP